MTMRNAAVLGSLAVILGIACNCGPSDRSPQPTSPSDPKNPSMTMTDTDPTSPEAWKQAEAIAAKAARGSLEKRSDDLPFMFMADVPAAVLVHKGRVVTEKGGKIAGEYLRDLGIIEGKGPKIADVLFVLFALDAWPPVKEVPKESYVNAPDNPAQKDITARVDFDGLTATINLVYFLGEPQIPRNPASNGKGVPDDVGGRDFSTKQNAVRPIVRCTLTIPKTGDPAWKVERMTWGG